MKTKNIIGLGLLSMVSILSSCTSDFFEKVSTETITTEAAFSNFTNIRSIVYGLNRTMFRTYNADQGSPGFGGIMITYDVAGEDMVYTFDNGWHRDVHQWIANANANSATVMYPYRFFYGMIQGANDVIGNVDLVVATQAEKDATKGQALIYRAWSHFNLVQIYGKRYVPGAVNSQLGVPLVIKATMEKLPRASVEEVYTQINKDLDEAIILLDKFTAPNKSNVNKAVALGLKARVALTQGNWAVAADFASQARAGKSLMSIADYTKGFNDFKNVEWMWGTYISDLNTESFGNFGAYQSRNFSSTVIRSNPKAINRTLYNLIPSTDVRSKLFSIDGNHPGITLDSRAKKAPFTSQKFLAVSTGDSRCDVPYMRVAEMYLIEAEAYAKAGNDTKAQTALFDLVSKRNPSYVLSTNTGAALQNEIMFQRRIELWGEGFRFLDLKRTGSNLDRSGAQHQATIAVVGISTPILSSDKRWQWLLPISEIQNNPNLIQNDL